LEYTKKGRLSMISPNRIVIVAVSCFVLAGAVAAPPFEKISVMIRGVDVEAHAGPDSTMGQYYTVQYALPEALESEQVDRAILELYVDIQAKNRQEYVNEAPVIEVFALTESPERGVDPEILDSATGAGRPVALGEARHVRIDITDIVRAHLGGILANNGLAIGSFSGMREGNITMVAGRFPDGAIAMLSISVSRRRN
jgi:hypothetical protein